MRPHTHAEACAVLDTVEHYQGLFSELFGQRKLYAADEYYVLTGRDFPSLDTYEGVPMHEDGIGMAATFEHEFANPSGVAAERHLGFFASVEGAPAEGYRGTRVSIARTSGTTSASPTVVLTSPMGASIIEPLVTGLGRDDVCVRPVDNDFFGGNTGVAGLMVGSDIDRVLESVGNEARVLLPDVCLSNNRFLDGTHLEELRRPVDVITSDGASLRRELTR